MKHYLFGLSSFQDGLWSGLMGLPESACTLTLLLLVLATGTETVLPRHCCIRLLFRACMVAVCARSMAEAEP